MSRTDQEQKNGLKRRARAWVCIRVNVYIWVACRNQESNEAFTQVLFAWQFRLVVKLTVLHLPFTQSYQPYSFRSTPPDVASDPIPLHFTQPFGSPQEMHTRSDQSPVTVTDSSLAKEWWYPRHYRATLRALPFRGCAQGYYSKSYPNHLNFELTVFAALKLLYAVGMYDSAHQSWHPSLASVRSMERCP